MLINLDPAAAPDLAAWIRTAIANPAAIAGVRRGPTWPETHEGHAEQQETLPDWQTRAVLTILHTAGRPMCERCEQPIHPDQGWTPPLPGVGLWEHTGTCPAAADDQTAGATR